MSLTVVVLYSILLVVTGLLLQHFTVGAVLEIRVFKPGLEKHSPLNYYLKALSQFWNRNNKGSDFFPPSGPHQTRSAFSHQTRSALKPRTPKLVKPAVKNKKRIYCSFLLSSPKPLKNWKMATSEFCGCFSARWSASSFLHSETKLHSLFCTF